MQKDQIQKELLAGFSEPSGDLQEQACITAIKAIAENENKAGMHSCFMINLRDFLLEYNR